MTSLRLLAALAVLLLAGCKNNDIPEEIASVFIERIRQMSSTIFAVNGSSSPIQVPLCPCCAKL